MARPDQRDKILDFVKREYDQNGYPPTLREIASYLRLKSRANIQKQLRQLCAEGELVNREGRYIPVSVHNSNVVTVPLLGTVAAGSPILAVENLEGYVAYLPRYGNSRDLFALRIKGDSMIEAGIFNGDIVVVEKTPVASDGDIVVALIDDEATVKTIYREKGRFRLQPQNKTMEPIIVNDVVVLGRVISSMRYY